MSWDGYRTTYAKTESLRYAPACAHISYSHITALLHFS